MEGCLNTMKFVLGQESTQETGQLKTCTTVFAICIELSAAFSNLAGHYAAESCTGQSRALLLVHDSLKQSRLCLPCLEDQMPFPAFLGQAAPGVLRNSMRAMLEGVQPGCKTLTLRYRMRIKTVLCDLSLLGLCGQNDWNFVRTVPVALCLPAPVEHSTPSMRAP
jgi:hypothetical protein